MVTTTGKFTHNIKGQSSILLSCYRCYSTDQKKPNRERLTERVLFPFCTRSLSRSVSVRYPFCIRSAPVLYPFCIRSVPVLYPFGIRSVSVPLAIYRYAFMKPVPRNDVSENICKNGATVICNFTKWVNCHFMRENG